jgi:PAS domain S-box-containing protein
MDGTEAAEIILRERELPIIFLSSHFEKEAVERTSRIGSYGFVSKSSGLEVLKASIGMAFRLNEERLRAEAGREAADRADARYRDFFENAVLGMFRTRLDGSIAAANRAFARIAGFEDAEELMASVADVGRRLWALPEERAEYLRILEAEGSVEGFESRLARKDGCLVWVSSSTRAVRGHDGSILFFEGSIADVTARRKAEERLEVLLSQKDAFLKELQHRVKNNLAVICSLLGLEAAKLPDGAARQVLVDAQSRMRAMTKIYERLYGSAGPASVELDLYLRDLASSILDTYAVDRKRIRLVTSLPRLRLDTKRAVVVGLIVNELMTNSLKHAYPVAAEGELRVELGAEVGELRLRVSDDGIGFPPSLELGGPLDFELKPSANMGLRLVDLLVAQIEGVVLFGGSPGKGAFVEVRFGL